MSNRDEQPFRFACQTCGSAIDLKLNKNEPGHLRGADQILEKLTFDEQTNFVDLHLDFPVSFDKYQPGHTPFLKALRRIGEKNYAIHNLRLNALNELSPLAPELRRVIRLYSRNPVLFSHLCQSRFDVRVASQKPQDINAALYCVIAKVFYPFAMPNDNASSVDKYMAVLRGLADKDKDSLDSFVQEITESNFLRNIQGDCLDIYPRILEAELPLRPALFLDFDHEYGKELIPLRVSTDDFQTYKDLYKDISEVMSRQFVLLAGINNLVHRGDFNRFKAGRKVPNSLHEYADIPFGLKLDYLDDSWYEIDRELVDNQLRNSIAHYKADYDEVNQLITYYPRREGIKQEKVEHLYFLDFMRKLLNSYREMHRMHQLIKCLYNYHFFVYKKPTVMRAASE